MATTAAGPAIGLDPDGAIKKFFKDPDWRQKCGIGSMLMAVSFLLVTSGQFFLLLLPLTLAVSSAVQGYMVRVTRSMIKKPDEPLPGWTNWIDLLLSGLIWMTVLCSQIVVLIAVPIISLYYGNNKHYLDALNAGFLPWAYMTIATMCFVAFLISFFLPLLMANFAEQEKITGLLDAKEAVRRLCNKPQAFLCAWLLGLGLFWLSVLVPLLTVIGVFFIPLTTFVAQVWNSIMLAQVWRSAED